MPIKEKKVKVGAMVPQSVLRDLQKIARWYRTKNLSHALRLLIEDSARGIEGGNGERKEGVG